jgi:hypothetical protein
VEFVEENKLGQHIQKILKHLKQTLPNNALGGFIY